MQPVAEVGLASHRVRWAWAFAAPTLIALALTAGWPLIRTVWLGFTDADLSGTSQAQFIGFENYLARYDGVWAGLLADPQWWRAVGNTLYFASVSVDLEIAVGLVARAACSTLASPVVHWCAPLSWCHGRFPQSSPRACGAGC